MKIQFTKKITLLSLASAIFGSFILAACGNTNQYPTTDVAGINAYAKTRDEDFKKAIADKTLQDLPITLITAAGKVNDNSFNQSIWEAIAKVSTQAQVTTNNFLETANETNLQNQYTSALNSGRKIWVLSGFQQYDAIKAWLAIAANKEKFEKNKIVVVGIDLALSDSDNLPKGQFISLNYKSNEAAFVVGYAAAAFLANKFSSQADKRVLSGFGGGTSSGVTDFLSGYLGGVGYFNHLDVNKSKQVIFNNDSIILNTGFLQNDTNRATIAGLLNLKTPQIILPVAGSLTGTTLDLAKANDNQFVIGVDTNQSLAFPNFANKFFSSIEKRVGLTAYKVLVALLLNKANSDEFFKDKNEQQFSLVGSTNPKNAFLKKGMLDEYVGYSASTLLAENKTDANKFLEEAKKVFETGKSSSSTEEESKKTSNTLSINGVQFYNEYTNKGIYIPDMSVSSKNQEYLNKFIKEYVNSTTKPTSATEKK